MRYSFVPLVATTVFAVASADVSIPSGCTHNPNWGNAIVQNKCSFDVYYILDNNAGKSTISGGSSASIPVYTKNADQGGMSVKLFKDPNTDIWSNPSLTQFELTPTNMLYYDISNVNSNIGSGMNGNGQANSKLPPFMNDGLKMQAGSNTVECKAGQNPCSAAYSNNNDDWATSAVGLSSDVTLIICPDGSSSGGSSSGSSNTNNNQAAAPQSAAAPPSSKPAPTPVAAPSPSAQPVKVEQKNAVNNNNNNNNNNNDVVYVTQTVTGATEQVTIFARSPAEEKEKRAEHLHQHVHNKIHKRRHDA